MLIFRSAVLIVLMGMAVSLMADSPADPDSMSREIADLRTRIQSLEARHYEDLLNTEKQKTIESVLADAQQKSQSMDIGSIIAGHRDGKFFIGSDDGNFNFRPWGYLQFREVTNRRQQFKNGHDDTQNGFEMRRAKFIFEGNAFSKDLTYNFSWGTSRASGTANVTNSTGTKIGTVSNSLGGVPVLDEAWIKYRINHGNFYIKAGQIKGPIVHEQMVSSRNQQFAERSVGADIFVNADTYLEAVDVAYEPGTWIRLEGAFTHGLRSANTNYLDYPNVNAFNYGAEARAEFKAFGQWNDYARQMGALGAKEQTLVFGLGGDYSERGHANQIVAVADATYIHPAGLSLYGAFMDRYTNHNFGIYSPSSTGANITTAPATVFNKPTNEYAAVIQVGYVFNQHIEPFARFEYLKLLGTPTGSKKYIPVVAAGANYYFYGHSLKLTGQITYLPTGLPIDDASNDLLASPGGNGEVVGILQVQFAF